MLQIVQPTIQYDKTQPRRIIHWKMIVKLPELLPVVFIANSLRDIVNFLGIKEVTLRKILFDKTYHSKKYSETLKYVSFEPVYNH